jgi:hypothetical protein
MKRMGPQLKMANLKMPPVFSDIYWDLRERHLLPLIALIVVAIVAVPFLLGGDSEEAAPEPVTAGTGGAVAIEAGRSATLAVVQAEPGLRDYHQRLSGRSPTDPFVQRYATPVTKGAELNEESGGSGEETTITTGGESESGGESGGGESGGGKSTGGGSSSGGQGITLFAFAIDAKVVRSGGKNSKSSKKETRVEHGVLPQEPLPGKKAEVVTYMGISKKGRPLLLVSADVQSVFGETKCVTGDEVCQLIEAEPGFPVVFVYGANEVHYTINVLKIKPVVTGRAPAKSK